MLRDERRAQWSIRRSGSDALAATAARANKARTNWEIWYQAEPLLALGLSFGAGVFLGWLVKRR